MRLSLVGGLVAVALHAPVAADDAVDGPSPPAGPLEPMVVTAVPMTDPYTVVTDPREPRLSMPAQDGGAFLDSIPGFWVSRKGGTSGDPVLRGLGGSRLNVLLDDAQILGGCGGRMDPPTAYVYPEAYDRIEVLKGPQSVRYGPTLAGYVRFDRDPLRFDGPTATGYGAATGGSFGRRDLVGDVAAGGRAGYARLIGTLSDQDDYEDGSGREVHSRYRRWSATTMLGWTPDALSSVEFAWDRSDGEAAYDDRGMDGVAFDRTGYRLSASRTSVTPWLAGVEAVLFYNYVDHVMDNYSLRTPPVQPMVSYPDRRTVGGRLAADVEPGWGLALHLGADWAENLHRSNQVGGPDAPDFRDVPRKDNAELEDTGAFVELERPLGERSRIVAGARVDRRVNRALDGIDFGGAEPGEVSRTTQHSGFVRLAHELEARPVTLYVGLGRAERAPDFWELRRAFSLASETLTQLDLGASLRGSRVRGTLAMFAGRIDDHILVVRPGLEPAEARNVDATTWGAEMDVTVQLAPRWGLTGTAAWVRSDNDTDGVPLAQVPPLEATLALAYRGERLFGGVMLRAVARQDRIHPGYGTIYSLDTTETPGYATVSGYGGLQLGKGLVATAGVDNLADRQYADHVQRGSADLGASSARIPEPGRTAWLRLAQEF